MNCHLNVEWSIPAFFLISENNWSSSKNVFRALAWKKLFLFSDYISSLTLIRGKIIPA